MESASQLCQRKKNMQCPDCKITMIKEQRVWQESDSILNLTAVNVYTYDIYKCYKCGIEIETEDY